jgi:hypothetical protein
MGLSRGGHNLDFIIEKDSIGLGREAELAMKIIAIVDQKCGVGKTTSTVRASLSLRKTGQTLLSPPCPNLKSPALNVDRSPNFGGGRGEPRFLFLRRP